MNCKVCSETFKGIESLIKHEATDNHQENVKKHRNVLFGCSNADIPAVHTEPVAVSAERSPIFTESVPAVTETIPVSAKSAPVFTEAILVYAQSAQVADETAPNAVLADSKIVRSKTNNLFSCMACSRGFSNLSDVLQHLESRLHETMVLATGIGFDEQVDVCEDDYNDLFPPLYYCIPCHFHCFDSMIYDEHLKERFHINIVKRMKRIFKLGILNGKDICFNEQTTKNGSKIGLRHFCKICYVQFISINDYRSHINGRKHRSFLPLMKKIAQGKQKNVDVSFNDKDTEKMSNSQYYCELCNISLNSNQYEKHLMWKTHKRAEKYINTMFFGNDEDIHIFDDSNNFKKFNYESCCLYYCEVCYLWCYGSETLKSHLNGQKHCSEMKQKRIAADYKPANNIKDSSPSRPKCEVCNIQFINSKRYNKHLRSKIHIRIEQILRELPKMKADVDGSCLEANHDADKSMQLPYYCKLCDVLCTCKKSYDSHLKGKTHKTIKKIMSTLTNETG